MRRTLTGMAAAPNGEALSDKIGQPHCRASSPAALGMTVLPDPAYPCEQDGVFDRDLALDPLGRWCVGFSSVEPEGSPMSDAVKNRARVPPRWVVRTVWSFERASRTEAGEARSLGRAGPDDDRAS